MSPDATLNALIIEKESVDETCVHTGATGVQGLSALVSPAVKYSSADVSARCWSLQPLPPVYKYVHAHAFWTLGSHMKWFYYKPWRLSPVHHLPPPAACVNLPLDRLASNSLSDWSSIDLWAGTPVRTLKSHWTRGALGWCDAAWNSRSSQVYERRRSLLSRKTQSFWRKKQPPTIV